MLLHATPFNCAFTSFRTYRYIFNKYMDGLLNSPIGHKPRCPNAQDGCCQQLHVQQMFVPRGPSSGNLQVPMRGVPVWMGCSGEGGRVLTPIGQALKKTQLIKCYIQQTVAVCSCGLGFKKVCSHVQIQEDTQKQGVFNRETTDLPRVVLSSLVDSCLSRGQMTRWKAVCLNVRCASFRWVLSIFSLVDYSLVIFGLRDLFGWHKLVCDWIGVAGEGMEEDDDMELEEWSVVSTGRGWGWGREIVGNSGNLSIKRGLEEITSDESVRVVCRKEVREEFKVILKFKKEDEHVNLTQ